MQVDAPVSGYQVESYADCKEGLALSAYDCAFFIELTKWEKW